MALMARETEYQKLEKDIRVLIASAQKAEEDRKTAIKMVKLLADALDAPEWQQVWTLLNAFASGDTQKQFARVEPMAVLADTYQGCAIIYNKARKALKAAELSGLLPEEDDEEAEQEAQEEAP